MSGRPEIVGKLAALLIEGKGPNSRAAQDYQHAYEELDTINKQGFRWGLRLLLSATGNESRATSKTPEEAS